MHHIKVQINYTFLLMNLINDLKLLNKKLRHRFK